jgi:hypothetical protein
MTTRQSCSLIAALTYLAVLAFPDSATAQSYQWTGIDAFTVSETDITTGQSVLDYSVTQLATLSLDLSGVGTGSVFADLTITNSAWTSFEVSGEVSDGIFQPNDVTGLIDNIFPESFYYAEFYGETSSNFGYTDYESYYYANPNLFVENFVFFTTSIGNFPEPPSLVLMAIGVLVSGVFAWARRPRPYVVDPVVRCRA